MRVFCLLAVAGLIAGAVWLHGHDMKGEAFFAACMVYLLMCFAFLGEVWVPVSNSATRRPYDGESRAELIRRDLDALKERYPDSKWPARHGAVTAVLFLGFLLWLGIWAVVLF